MTDVHNGGSTTERLLRSTSGYVFNLLLRLLEVFTFSLAVLAVVIMIGEIAARSALQAQYLQEIRDNAEFLAKAEVKGGQGALPTAPESASPNTGDNLEALASLQNALRDLRSLQSIGAHKQRLTLSGISARYHPDNGLRSFDEDSIGSDALFGWLGSDALELLAWHSRASSETLLATIVCLSGLIGGLVSGFRDNVATLHRDIPLGLSAGFIVYLAIKGGKFIFMVQSVEQGFAMNPYGCAFAGLIAGLFTEKAYALLQTLVDELVLRVTGGNGKAAATDQAGLPNGAKTNGQTDGGGKKEKDGDQKLGVN